MPKIKFTNDEVRLAIDVLKGEEMRLHAIRQDAPTGAPDWFDQRVDEVAALKERFKMVRSRL